MDNRQFIGVVVIGRNEGTRLKTCIGSLVPKIKKIVYVDSGSTDDSVVFSESKGIDVIQLDMTLPFSAARARNEGFGFLIQKYPELKYIQFIDGDCELCEGWISAAENYLRNHATFALVSGRRKERYPEKSIYNRLCDIEWDTPPGKVDSCGGDFMIRKEAFGGVEGFNPAVVAGEEPEMCYRLRQKGWEIYRLEQDMTIHDAAILSFIQWCKRAVRSGHAYAQGYALHGKSDDKYCLANCFRIWLWSFIVPIICIASVFLNGIGWILLFAVYPLQVLKVSMKTDVRSTCGKYSLIYSTFVMIAKWPQLLGQINFWFNRINKKKHEIIEYK